ncbi:hypothetical protein BJF79_45470 [Actinomadura sp. CNU-125]|nr:hypothetical protein BJF79_45470 [Actinomadura sp. CNU-125]
MTTSLACAVALTVPTLRGANRTFVEAQAGIGRTARGRLRRSRRAASRCCSSRPSRSGSSPATARTVRAAVAAAPRRASTRSSCPAPRWACSRAGVLLLRLLPVATRAAERFAAGGRGLVPVLGARQVGRRPLRYAGPVLLLVMRWPSASCR